MLDNDYINCSRTEVPDSNLIIYWFGRRLIKTFLDLISFVHSHGTVWLCQIAYYASHLNEVVHSREWHYHTFFFGVVFWLYLTYTFQGFLKYFHPKNYSIRFFFLRMFRFYMNMILVFGGAKIARRVKITVKL